MKIRGLKRARQIAQRAREKFCPKFAILLYHRVADMACDPWELCVSPEHFAAQLRLLKQRGPVYRLEEMAALLRRGEPIPAKACVVTFDDGYADNLYVAEPLLAELEIPATIFMTSGTVGRSREFWWDELEKVFLQPGRLPPLLRLRIDSQVPEWKLGGAADYSEAAFQLHCGWHVANKRAPTARQQAYKSVYYALQQLPRETRDPVIDEIVDWAGASRAVRPTHRALSPEETRTLASSQWITIGAHTVTHQSLQGQPAEVQREEISGSKTQIEQLLGKAVNTFSYPYGQHTDASAEIVEQTGFSCACACLDRPATRHSSLFRLPRLMVRNWNEKEFALRLDHWLK